MDQENIRIIVPHVFVQKLQTAFASCAFVFISAHTGWGKTSVVETLLAVYTSWIDERLSDYNAAFYYQPRDYLAECCRQGTVLDG